MLIISIMQHLPFKLQYYFLAPQTSLTYLPTIAEVYVVPVKPPKGHFKFAGRLFLRVPWWRMKNLRTLYFYIVVLIPTNTANGFDGSLMNDLQSLPYWQKYFNHANGPILGFFNASMSLGSLIGLFFTPYLIDWAGRRIGVALGCTIMLLAVGLQLMLRFGDTIVLGSAPLIIAEIPHLQDRAILVTLSGASYHSGAYFASWSDWSWRLLSLLQAICTLLILIGIWWMSESPLLVHYHGEDNEADEFVQLEYAESGQSNWSDFLRKKGNRERTAIIAAVGFFSYWGDDPCISLRLSERLSRSISGPSARYGIAPANGLGYAFVVMIFLYDIFNGFKSPKGFTWLNFYVTAALFFNQYIDAIGLDALAWKYCLFYCIFLTFGKRFDGDGAVDVGEVATADIKEKGIKLVEEGQKKSCCEMG
ncbi:hypothetical protein K469DRAFT_729146 [Zopfia rhizophila CBS 207.26]|uniref:MFS general substrate transporter n=1 Tax=Zopfia rhizophila CBS 207.26 TaxID=1314779 RepID=A0A6A6DUG4_9PEZI|nr:hypothetical protein K469DRAFT_729146 [Zopfia rhizophila CBS 207.26]